MANTIKIKRGLSENVSDLTLQSGELGVVLDTHELYVGDQNGAKHLVKGTATVADRASTADSATKATKDAEGQQIDTTYIKGLSVSGRTITYTKGNGTTGTITTQDTDTTYNEATTTVAGLMSAADKEKLDGIAAGAQVNTVTGVKGSSESSYRTGNVNITKANIGLSNVENKTSATIRGEITSANIATALGYTPADSDEATTTAAGLMSAGDKTKLNGIATGAEVNVQSDWNVTDSSSDAFIKNKPTSMPASDVASWAKAASKPPYTKSEVGLGNVDNKSSATIRGEITSANVTSALGFTPMNAALKGAANGVAELGSDGKVPAAQLPAYVDDVLEYSAKSGFPTTGETGKIYVDQSNNKTYRWSGSAYVEISASLALGTTSSTAYRGDYGNAAYAHSVTNKGAAFGSGLYKITTNAEGHVTAATAVAKADITALGIPASNTNTTYTLTQDASDGHKITLTPSSGTATTITIPDNNTTYSNVSTSAAGLVPKATGSTANFLRADGTWATPPDTKYTLPAATSSALGGVKSGTDITVDSSGNVSINDDSHNHVISNVDGLQSALDGKQAAGSYISATNTGVQSIQGGLILGGTSATATARGRLMITGHTNPLIGLQAIDSEGIQLTPYYFQVANDVMYIGPTSAKALAFDRDGNTTIPGNVSITQSKNLTVSGSLSVTGTISGPAATTTTAGLMSATDKTKLNNTNMAYGTCSTAAATAAKVITVSGNTNWTLAAGSVISILFTNTNTAESPTFNVNGTGTKNVYYGASQITTGSLSYAGYANRPCNYVYDGTQYRFIGWGYDSNTTYTNVKLGHGYATCSTAAATVAKVGTLSSYTLTTGGIVAVKFTNSVPANATLNINSKGAKPIYYKGKAIVDGIICAGEVATFIYSGGYYHLLTIDRNRFFNSLVPYGTRITATEAAPVTLNTAAYQVVGNYYCSSNAECAYITDLPKKNTAFMMQVLSPLSQTVDNETGTWVYRVRKLQYYTGEEYIQYNYTNGTAGNWIYGVWKKITTDSDLSTYATKSYVDTAIGGALAASY